MNRLRDDDDPYLVEEASDEEPALSRWAPLPARASCAPPVSSPCRACQAWHLGVWPTRSGRAWEGESRAKLVPDGVQRAGVSFAWDRPARVRFLPLHNHRARPGVIPDCRTRCSTCKANNNSNNKRKKDAPQQQQSQTKNPCDMQAPWQCEPKAGRSLISGSSSQLGETRIILGFRGFYSEALTLRAPLSWTE